MKTNNVPQQKVVSAFTNEVKYEKIFNTPNDIFIRIPTDYKDYSNFKPTKFQPCIVRDMSLEKWKIGVCSGIDAYHFPVFYTHISKDDSVHYEQYLPLSKFTEQLIGTTMSYEELIQKLNKE